MRMTGNMITVAGSEAASIDLPPRQTDDGYVRPPLAEQHFVPDEY